MAFLVPAVHLYPSNLHFLAFSALRFLNNLPVINGAYGFESNQRLLHSDKRYLPQWVLSEQITAFCAVRDDRVRRDTGTIAEVTRRASFLVVWHKSAHSLTQGIFT
jgi:hypothetical protein